MGPIDGRGFSEHTDRGGPVSGGSHGRTTFIPVDTIPEEAIDMAKKILIISTSLRKESNTEILAHGFEKGAKEAGNEVEFVSLKGKKIAFCSGCNMCLKTGRCNIRDDANAITDKMAKAQVIVWAAPIYYYQVPGQMKTMIDRSNALFALENEIREVYMLMACADESMKAAEGPIKGIFGWIDCLPNVEFKGYVCATATGEPNSVLESPAFMQAYNLGKSIS